MAKKPRPLRQIPRNFRSLYIVLLLLIVIVICVPAVVLSIRRENTRSMSSITLFNIDRGSFDSLKGTLANPDQINIIMKATQVDYATQTITFKVRFNPTGNYSIRDGGGLQPALQLPAGVNALNIQFGEITTSSRRFISDQPMPGMDLSLPMVDGSVADYPLDDYRSSLAIVPQFDSTGNGPPIGLLVDRSLQNFRIEEVLRPIQQDPSTASANSTTVYTMNFRIRQSISTIAFAILLFLLMWFLSLAALAVAMDMLLRKRKPDAPLVAMSCALIFSLPALRNASPGAPQGAIVYLDMVGFVLTMLISGISALILMTYYVVGYRDRKMIIRPSSILLSPARTAGNSSATSINTNCKDGDYDDDDSILISSRPFTATTILVPEECREV